MRHRYIFCGTAKGTDKICDYRLLSSCTKYSCGSFIRVNIPDDMKLDTFPYDGYSTTDDQRTLDELGYDCYFLFNGKWRKFNELKKYPPCEWYQVLEYIYGLYDLPEFDYTDDEEVYNQIMNEYYTGKRKYLSESEIVFPCFKEDKNGLKLPFKVVDELPFNYEENQYTWVKVYNQLKSENE